MTWEWPRSGEVYANAYEHLRSLDNNTLAEILAEWWSCVPTDSVTGPDLDEQHYSRVISEAHDYVRQSHESAVLDIWECASEQAECTNGGHELHMCPFHCGPHSVPPDPIEETEEH